MAKVTDFYKDYKFNFLVNILDGGFFGLALGFASFMTVIPLYVSTLTSSATLIGLIPAIQGVGWQLPQLFTAKVVSKLSRYKPMVIFMTIHERVPFLAIALVVWLSSRLNPVVTLSLIYLMLIWQGLGGGFTATAWQSLVGKIIPPDRHGTFFGFQAASASLLMSGSAILAGIILYRYDSPLDFTLCFLLAGISMLVSLAFLALTREDETPSEQVMPLQGKFTTQMMEILRADKPFRGFILVRVLSEFSVMAFAFYTVYAVRQHQMSEATAGIMTSVFTFGQIIANPLMGWIGDRFSRPAVMKFGAVAAAASSLLAGLAPRLGWFYLVFILAGLANVAIWTIGLAMTLQFGTKANRPVYIGMANTLVAPATILSPIFGGWLADTAGFKTTFFVSAFCGLATALVLQFLVRLPKPVVEVEEEDAAI